MVSASKNILKSDKEIVVLGEYHSYWLKNNIERNPDFDDYSGKILDLKNKKKPAISYFFHQVGKMLEQKDCSICVLPPHSPESPKSGIQIVARLLCTVHNCTDATNSLVRTKEIPKLARGGNRSLDAQIESMACAHKALVKGRPVLLMDDVSTTGNSLAAGKRLLLEAGARYVQCVVLGKTAWNRVDPPF